MLDDLMYKSGVVTRMISAENPTGEKGKACMAKPSTTDPFLFHSSKSLGEGWKVNPFIRIAPQSKIVIADIKGSGIIKQFFLTSDRERFSELIIRMWWDDEETPSVECPLGAFFCMGHDSKPHQVNSLPVVVAPHRGCNCYWSMPFRKDAKNEIENEGETYTEILAYKVLWHEVEVSEDAAYFHAQYRRSTTTTENPCHVILDNVKGKGVYVGTYLAWTALNSGWWGEGEVKFYIDGDTKYPTICDNGTEDYFGGAWNFGGYGILGDKPEQEFNSPYLGLPLASVKDQNSPNRFSMYRFHIEDCIGFSEDLKVTVDTIAWRRDYRKYKHSSEDVASVAFWYQSEPHQEFKKLPSIYDRYDR